MIETSAKHHLARVVFAYSAQNFDRAVADFSAALGIDFGSVLEPPGMGLRIAISLASGIELIAPAADEGFGSAIADWVNEVGEGFFGIVYRVPSLESGLATASGAGWPEVGERIDCFQANPAWRSRFASLTEAMIPPIAGISVTLIAGKELQSAGS